jgi:hypothetical protein
MNPMNAFLSWLRGFRSPRAHANVATADSAANVDLLSRARALVAEGRLPDASRVYALMKKNQRSTESLVEHAEVLLKVGDHFGAASRASQALVLDPSNLRAKAVQRHVCHEEESEQRRRRGSP